MKNHISFYYDTSVSGNRFTLNNIMNDHFVRKITLESLLIQDSSTPINDVAMKWVWTGTARSTQGDKLIIPIYPNAANDQAKFYSREPFTLYETTSKLTKTNNPNFNYSLFRIDDSVFSTEKVSMVLEIEYDPSVYYHETNTREDYRQRHLQV